MPLELETRNREAFELVTEALEFIDRYRESRDVATLKDATVRLTQAREKDPNYFRARYYDAIVDDLSGRFRVAAEKLTGLLRESPPLADEVRYNLGLAEYHGYSHSALERAIEQFKQVQKSVKDQSLRLRAQAGLAQAYAMHMIPKEYDKPDLERMKAYRDLAFSCVSQVLRELRVVRFQRLIPLRKPSVDSGAAAEIGWTAHNAKGMTLMYYADYLPRIEKLPDDRGREQQVANVRSALSELTQAEKIHAGDWANRCDLASANMRLGYFNAEPERFEEALKILQDVIDRLRPGYAFAIYETGRVLRLKGEYDKAIERFDAALKIPEEQRDVSARRLNTERQRAESRDGTFP
jgi:tetratricopeptide (TPR) repeat protein